MGRWLLIALVLTTASVRELCAETKTKVALTPDLEEKLADFLKKVGEAKRKVWAARMKQELKRMATTSDLSSEESQALEDLAKNATEACIPDWTEKLGDSWRAYLARYEEIEDEMATDRMLSTVDQAAQSDWFGDYLRPFEHPIWNEGLRRVLSAEKAAAWEKAQAERREAVVKEGADLLKASLEGAGQQQRTRLLGKNAAIKSRLSLSQETSEKLDTLAKTIADAGIESLRRRGERMLLAMDDVQRQQTLKARRFYVNAEQKDFEKQLAAWKEGVEGLLSAEQKKQWLESTAAFNARRVVVFGKILITLLDDRIAFTQSQRERLEPIAERLVQAQEALFEETVDEEQYDQAVLFQAAGRASEEELKMILDSSQWKRWKEACLPGSSRTARRATRKAELGREPEDVESVISDWFYEKAGSEQKFFLNFSLLKAEDAGRVASLPADAIGRLETAARGVTELAWAAWKTNTEHNIRAQLQDVTVDNVKQRLAGIGSYAYRRNLAATAAEASIWEKAIKEELSEAQQAAWKKEQELRTVYRGQAVLPHVLLGLDEKVALTPEQRTKLETMLAGILKEYLPDIESMYSNNGYAHAWYLQTSLALMPIAAVPEADLKAILSKEQWKSWTENPELENLSSYWENVRTQHEQRAEAAKERKKNEGKKEVKK